MYGRGSGALIDSERRKYGSCYIALCAALHENACLRRIFVREKTLFVGESDAHDTISDCAEGRETGDYQRKNAILPKYQGKMYATLPESPFSTFTVYCFHNFSFLLHKLALCRELCIDRIKNVLFLILDLASTPRE